MKIKIDGQLYDIDKRLYKRGIKRATLFENATDLVLWHSEPETLESEVLFHQRRKSTWLERLMYGKMVSWDCYKIVGEREGLHILQAYRVAEKQGIA